MRVTSATVAKTVGDRIRERRLELGLSQRQLSCDGVSYAYISRLESNDRTASITALRKIARRLDVSAHWLETGKRDPAEELAKLVIDHQGEPLPARAVTLARKLARTTSQT